MQVSLRYALRERAAQLASIWASFGNQCLPETQQICLNYLRMLPWLSIGHFILVAACFMSVVLSPSCGAEYVFSCCLVIPGASPEHVFNYSFTAGGTLMAQLPRPGLSFHGDALLQLIFLRTCGNLVFKSDLQDRNYASWEIQAWTPL